jgi:hypothetical protein
MSTSPRVSVSEDSYLNPEPHDVIHTGLSAELSIYDTQNGGFYTIYLYFDTNIDLDLLLNMYEMDWCNANVPTLLNYVKEDDSNKEILEAVDKVSWLKCDDICFWEHAQDKKFIAIID